MQMIKLPFVILHFLSVADVIFTRLSLERTRIYYYCPQHSASLFELLPISTIPTNIVHKLDFAQD